MRSSATGFGSWPCGKASACASTPAAVATGAGNCPPPVRSAVLDGEGVICGPDGKSDFDRMRACFSRQGAPKAFLYAFDLLELDGGRGH